MVPRPLEVEPHRLEEEQVLQEVMAVLSHSEEEEVGAGMKTCPPALVQDTSPIHFMPLGLETAPPIPLHATVGSKQFS